MKKMIAFLLTLLLGAVLWGEEDIVLVALEGQVEIRRPGGSWEAAEQGMALTKLTMISTGFRSQAVLEIGNARTTVQPLSRLEIREVELGPREQNTALFLGAGRIRADVKKSRDIAVDFSVSTPVATAAVRGTAFELSTTTLTVHEGVVSCTIDGYTVYVKKGGRTTLQRGGGNPLSSPYDEAYPANNPVFSPYAESRRTRGAAGGGTGQPVITVD